MHMSHPVCYCYFGAFLSSSVTAVYGTFILDFPTAPPRYLECLHVSHRNHLKADCLYSQCVCVISVEAVTSLEY